MDLAADKKKERFESQLSPVAHLLVAYCLLQETADLSREDLADCHQLARILIAKSAESRRRTKGTTVVAPLEHALRSLVHSHLGEWEEAKGSVVKALSDRSLQRRYHTVDVECINQYYKLLEENGSEADFLEMVSSRSEGLLRMLAHETSNQSIRPDLRDVFFHGIGRVEQADVWLRTLLEMERDPQKRSKRARSVQGAEMDRTLEVETPRFRYSKRTQATGPLLFIVLSQQPDRVEEALGVLRQLFYHDLWISPHHVADLCSHLTRLGRSLQVLECYTRLVKAQQDLSHSALRRMMYILLENGYLADAADVQKQIIKHHCASERDKEALAFHYSSRGDVANTIEALQIAFGDRFMRDVRSLRLLLEANITSKDIASADRIINTIARLATEDTAHLNFLLNFYATRGKVTQALALFDEFLAEGYGRPDLDTFRALARLFAEQGDMKNIDRIVQAAVSAGITLDGPFCGQILEAGIQTQDWVTVSRRWMSFPPEIKAHPDVVTAIQKSFVFLAVPFNFVVSFFREIRSPTADQWHLVILSACDAGRPDLGRLLLKEMDRRARYVAGAPYANRYIFTTLMHGYLRENNQHMAKKTYEEMIARNVAPSSVTYAMIISSFLSGDISSAKAEQAHRFAMSIWDEAQQGKLPERGDQARLVPARLFGRLITTSGQLGQLNKAQMYYDLASQHAEPTVELRTMLMQAYKNSGKVQEVVAQWNELFDRAKQNLNTADIDETVPRNNSLVRPLCITLEALSLKGRYTAVVSTWKSVVKSGFGLDSECYNAYARALARSGDIFGAFWIVEKLLLPRHDEVERRSHVSTRLQKMLEVVRPSTALFTENELLLEDEQRLNAMMGEGIIDAANPSLLAQYQGIVPVTASEILETANASQRPSDLRPSNRAAFHANPSSLGQWHDHDPFEITRQLLEQWRPGDVSWRPNNTLRQVLSSAYGQLQALAMKHKRMLQSQDPKFAAAAAKARRSGPIRLPEFGVYMRVRGGEKAIDYPAAVLFNLNCKFPRTVELLLSFRKRSERMQFEGSQNETELVRFKKSLEKSEMNTRKDRTSRRQRRIAYRLQVVKNRISDVRYAKRHQTIPSASVLDANSRLQLATYQRKGFVERMRERSARRKAAQAIAPDTRRIPTSTWRAWMGLNHDKWKRVRRHNEIRRLGKISHFKGRWGLRKHSVASASLQSRQEERKEMLERAIRKRQVEEWKKQQEEWKMLGRTRSRPRMTAKRAKMEVEQELTERRTTASARKGEKEEKRRKARRYRRMTYGTKSE